ncbi:MAG: hypothetical protein WCJ58_08690 [bacterium]
MKIFNVTKNIFGLFLIIFFALILKPAPVAAGTITLSPTSGVAGMEVFVTGTTFDNSSTATFLWDSTPLTTIPALVTTTVAGALPANVSFVVPSSNLGPHIIRVSTSAGNYATSVFTISTPAIAISSPTVPAAGLPVGLPITITGTNFEGSKATNVYFDNTIVANTTTSYNGSFQSTFTIPDINNTGAHIIKASNSTYAIFNLTLVVATPALVASPIAGPAGYNVTLTGTNFKANADVYFLINGEALTVDVPVVANGAGSFATTFTVPDLAQGTITLKAYSYTGLYAVATFTIATPAITLTPGGLAATPLSPGLPVNIFGTNFKSNAPISILVNNIAVSAVGAPIIANNQGEFGATIIFPNISPGVSTIRVQSSNNLFAVTTVIVATTALTLTPNTGPDNLQIHAAGSGFQANATVSFYLDGTALSDTTTTNSVGYFTTQIKIPGGLNYGAHTLRAETPNSVANSIYTVTAAAITLSPATGAPGSKVVISGTNFDPNQSISFKWDGKTTSAVNKVSTSSSGSFTVDFIVPPDTLAGVHQLEAYSGDVSVSVATFTTTAQTLVMSPTSGNTGMKITATGTNFAANQSIILYWDDATVLSTDPSSLTTSAGGGFTTVFTVPSATRGTHYIKAIGEKSDNIAIASFAIAGPAVTLDLYSSQPGKVVRIYGSSFDPKTAVSFLWDDSTTITTDTPSVITDDIGSFSTNITIPENSSPGDHKITIGTSAIVYTSSTFSVTSGELTLSMDNGYLGSTIIITGKKFDGNALVKLFWDNIEDTSYDDIETDGIGGFKLTYKIPDCYPGSHSIRMTTSQFYTSMSTFTVNASKIVISPENPAIGSNIMISGQGFKPGETMILKINGKNKKLSNTENKSDTSGNFSVSTKVPFIFGHNLDIQLSTNNYDKAIMNVTISNPVFDFIADLFFIISSVAVLALLYVLIKLGIERGIFQKILSRLSNLTKSFKKSASLHKINFPKS